MLLLMDCLQLICTAMLTAGTTASQNGIDVSHYQGTIDWSRVKASGVTFAVAKATEGSNYVDPTFNTNLQGMKQNGMQAGGYLYFRGADSVSGQTSLIRSTLAKSGFDNVHDILAIDVEAGGNQNVSPIQMANNLRALLENLKGTYSKLYIYTGPYYWNNKIAWKTYDFSQYPLWIANYNTHSPIIPTTWKNKGYTLWQYSDEGTVPGITGNVDLDRSR